VVRNYLDDMVVDAVSWSDMLSKLRQVFDRLKSANLTLKPSECLFGTRRIEFLGFVVEGGMIQPREEKTRCIAEYPRPSDAHSVRRFSGLIGFFRRFVKDYSKIAKPLTRLTKKDVVYEWSPETEEAFRTMKRLLTGPLIQAMFNSKSEVIELHTDASSVGLGAMLMQTGKEGEPLRLVYCASRTTSEAESSYHSSKLELMCIVWAVRKLRQFLLGVRFTVYTDCQALV